MTAATFPQKISAPLFFSAPSSVGARIPAYVHCRVRVRVRLPVHACMRCHGCLRVRVRVSGRTRDRARVRVSGDEETTSKQSPVRFCVFWTIVSWSMQFSIYFILLLDTSSLSASPSHGTVSLEQK